MDPPPQAHIGVGIGHVPEYSMTVLTGQLVVTMWTQC